jgi:hypothetical protein
MMRPGPRPALPRRTACMAAGGILAAAMAAPAAAEPRTIPIDDALASMTPPAAALAPDGGETLPSPLAEACEPAIAAAAAAHDVPGELLLAIGMVESGLSPWVVNAEGTPYFFEDRAQATAGLERLRAEGVESIDVGCMQINLRWHPTAFPDAATALDPMANADYAASFLLSLFAMTGSWTDAVAYYHSSAQRYQRPYVCAVAARLEELGSAMSLECLPAEELDLPQVASAPPSAIDVPPAAAAGSSHMLRVAPATGSVPTIVRGQDAPPGATDSAGPRVGGGPRIIRLR